ncbi:MAG: HAD family hydrolase [Acidobacteria bacterium]|nr:HAD family hydrolase [Acidobacteriota bacterium]
MAPLPIPADLASLQSWLPAAPPDWKQQVSEAARSNDLRALRKLSQFQLDFLAAAKLDRAIQQVLSQTASHDLSEIRLAILASSTTHHLVASLRAAALRRGIVLHVHECGYGQYMQELALPDSPLYAFAPQVVLFAFDAHHLVELAQSGFDPLQRMRNAWKLARDHFHATVLQQTVLPLFPALLGSNEHHHDGSPHQIVRTLNHDLHVSAKEDGVHLLAIDDVAAQDGLRTWHDPAMWFRAKQEVHPAAAPLYGELVAPVLAALTGRSAKCLVLDLDNTLWGGVIGDDGIEGIALGQGHAAGEAFLEFQQYCLRLRERGVLLAICSKNTETLALAAIAEHKAMLLRPEHFAAMQINWNDKATNLRKIARTLNIGVEALVFADDNPFERTLVRRELPEVSVPELPDDPAGFATTIARGGYFESLGLTAEDLARATQYKANADREQMRASATDLDSYLRSLKMELRYRPFDEANLPRIAQLIGKTNQFNLTTRRYTAEELRGIMADPNAVTLQFALTDAFGDNGTIALVIAYAEEDALRIDTWLMSCRVLGRRMEEAALQGLVEAARSRGLSHIVGEVRPTPKNVIVRDLYTRLGFSKFAPQTTPQEEGSWFAMKISAYTNSDLPMLAVME